jgi:putative DNA primase/helicase
MAGINGAHSPIDAVLSRLDKVKKNDRGWMASCPAHDDRNPSLSLTIAPDGKVLLYCHAGCEPPDICSAMGLSMQDLFPDQPKPEPRRSKGQIAATYEYRDAGGTLLFQVLRYEPKGFTQRRLGPDGSWIYNLENTPRTLYRLPELLASNPLDVVYIPEGEKDVERLRELGLVATCNPHGARKWLPEYSQHLAGRNVVIVPDNDEAGRKHTAVLVQALYGVAKAVKVVKLPGLKEGQDISNWLDAGGTLKELRGLVRETPVVQEQHAPGSGYDAPQYEDASYSGADEPPTPHEAPRPRMHAVRIADVTAEEVDYLWGGFLAMKKFALWEGDPGIGKTYALLAAGAAVTRGWGLPGMPEREPANVMLLTMEDDLADTIRPRLELLDADLTRFYAYDQPLHLDNGGIADLSAELARVKPALLVIDPIMAYVSGKIDIYKPNQIRLITTPLSMLAREHGCAVVGIRHITKAEKQRAIYRGNGGMDWVGASRLVVLVGNDPDRPGRKVIVQTKTNVGQPVKAVGFTLEDGRFVFTDAPQTTAERVLSGNGGDEDDEDDVSAVEEAMDFLRQCLIYPKKGTDVRREAKQQQISESTLKRARRRLKVGSKRHNIKGGATGGEGAWYWSLPTDEDQEDQEDQESHPLRG